MKKVGNLYGADLMIDTDDEIVVSNTIAFLEKNCRPKMSTDNLMPGCNHDVLSHETTLRPILMPLSDERFKLPNVRCSVCKNQYRYDITV